MKIWFHPKRILILALVLSALGRLGAADAELSLSLPQGTKPLMQGVVYRFFDDRSGYCTGHMKVDRVDMEYRRQGFMRVAWRPLVVLSKVEFEFGDEMSWAAKGAEVGRDLLALGGREEFILRDVRLKMAGSPNCEVVAASARLLPAGILEFNEATLAEQGGEVRAVGTIRLHLTGPDAGRLLASTPNASPKHISSRHAQHSFTP